MFTSLSIVLVVVLSAVAPPTTGACPTPEVAAPCKCQDKLITCDGDLSVIKQALKRISSASHDKDFDNLRLSASVNETDIGPDFTGDLRFRQIDIYPDTRGLITLRVHKHAFRSSAESLKSLQVQFYNVSVGPEPYNIFSAVNSLVNIETLVLWGVSFVPERAFGRLTKFNTMSLMSAFKPFTFPVAGKPIVGVDAFNQLPNLKHLQLIVDRLPANALHLNKTSQTDQPLAIELGSWLFNSLNGSSFDLGSLNGIERQSVDLTVNLNDKTMTDRYLNEAVFRPFLDSNQGHSLYLPIGDWSSHSWLNCTDCRNAWLVRHKDKYEKVVRAFCSDRQEDRQNVFKQKFEHCK